MPRNLAPCVLVLLGGCLFDADYRGGSYKCSDGQCPSGLVCDRAANRCVSTTVGDGGIDAPGDAIVDAPPHALTCTDPGVIAATGGSDTSTTVGRSSMISAMCSGFVMNGADAVYRLNAAAGDQFLVSITDVKAYVLTTCSESPATPACVGNMIASMGDPISVTAATAGPLFIVVDHESPATTSAYTLTVAKQ